MVSEILDRRAKLIARFDNEKAALRRLFVNSSTD
jgi:hypothetical protein